MGKYEVTLVSGGQVYTDVASVSENTLNYYPNTHPNGPGITCVNEEQPGCKSPLCCKDYKARFCCGGNIITPTVSPCKKWVGATGEELYSLALSPNMIGDPNTEKRCKIIDNRKCTTCACDYYVRYSEDGGSTWLGLTFGGAPGQGGTGCPGYGMTQATWEQALAWLQDEHINKGRCGCVDEETCKWTNWYDKDDPSGKGDYEMSELVNRCEVEKYEVTLVSGGQVYTDVASVSENTLNYYPNTHPNGPGITCVNEEQPGCKSPLCCKDYKARFCC